MRGGRRPGAGRKPGAVNKTTLEIKALARAHTAEALKRLLTELKDGDTSAARIMAANSILDRGWGKPKQDMAIEHRHSFVDALREIERIAREPTAILGTSVAQIEDQPAPLRH